jgi:hypothetical protein
MVEKYFSSTVRIIVSQTSFLLGSLFDRQKALIPATGLETRFLPATKSMPKERLYHKGK